MAKDKGKKGKKPTDAPAAPGGGGKEALPSMKTVDKSREALEQLASEMKGKMEGVQKPKGKGGMTPPPSAK